MTRRGAIACLGVLLLGCGRQQAGPEAGSAPPSGAESPGARTAQPDGRPVIVAFGDSLTAGAGLEPGSSYADFLQRALDRAGYRYRVVNQGISGDTSGGGVGRIGAALSLKPKVVILELGANDGLRGLPVATTRQNLEQVIDASLAAGARVLLGGMTLPRNYGPDYIRTFESVFRDLAREKKVSLIPFFLEGVATRPELMQSDGLHPTAEGSAIVAATVMKYLAPLLDEKPGRIGH